MNTLPKVECIGNVGGLATQSRSVYLPDGVSPTLQAGMTHGNTVPYIIEKRVDCVAMRGRYPDENTASEQTLEVYSEKTSHSITTVQKDNLVMIRQKTNEDLFKNWVWMIDGQKYLIRIRKLTPRECWRLMDFSDEDFEKAQAVNSNTQLYKQAGNSIVKNVLCEVFKELIE